MMWQNPRLQGEDLDFPLGERGCVAESGEHYLSILFRIPINDLFPDLVKIVEGGLN